MAISFECESCGKAFTVRDELAGKTGQCKQCGQRMTIPRESDSEAYGLDDPGPEPAPEPHPQAAALPPRAFKPAPTSSPAPGRRPLFNSPSKPAKKKGGFFAFGRNEGGLVGALVLLVGLGLRFYFRWERAQARNAGNNPANAMAPPNVGGPVFNPPGAFAADRSGPIRLPNFPDPGPAREVEPGIMLREVTLGPALGAAPGHGGKLWLYTPPGDHAEKSLPCVLITGAGSNLLTGMDLSDGDRPEHLPYVRAGFAVLAFELDGVPQDREQPNDQDLARAMSRFLNARAGLVNAHIALEYALAKVPEVDPARISVAGHSSAGTLAVLLAENEPRLKACAAFAPAVDLPKRFGAQGVAAVRQAGGGDLLGRYSPNANVDKLQVPVFLFHARDDSNVPVGDTQAFVNLLKGRGKSVTLDLVDSGNHYDSMINEGIPHAIAWLNEQGAGPK